MTGNHSDCCGWTALYGYASQTSDGGIPEEKIICCDEEPDTEKYVDLNKAEHVYILHDIYTTQYARAIQKNLGEHLKKEGR